jgi:hypothetical protein
MSEPIKQIRLQIDPILEDLRIAYDQGLDLLDFGTDRELIFEVLGGIEKTFPRRLSS